MTFKEFIQEDFYTLTKQKNTWVDLSKVPQAEHDPHLKENLFDLVTLAYTKSLGEPNYSIKSRDSVLSRNYDYWEAIDLNENPDAEACIFGKKRNGIKLSGIGHNGEKLSKSVLIRALVDQLNRKGFWIEASDRLAEVLKLKGVPIINDPNVILKLFPGSKIVQWNEDNSYIRTIPDSAKGRQVTRTEYIFGHPLI